MTDALASLVDRGSTPLLATSSFDASSLVSSPPSSSHRGRWTFLDQLSQRVRFRTYSVYDRRIFSGSCRAGLNGLDSSL